MAQSWGFGPEAGWGWARKEGRRRFNRRFSVLSTAAMVEAARDVYRAVVSMR